MIMDTGPTVSKIHTGQKSEQSDHNETDYNSPRMQFRIIDTIELECILNGFYF